MNTVAVNAVNTQKKPVVEMEQIHKEKQRKALTLDALRKTPLEIEETARLPRPESPSSC